MSLQFNPFTGTFDVTTKGDTGTVAAAGDGTAALPGIAFASDLDSGIYRVGANSLGISTGGTGRLFVDASGNVGVDYTNGAAIGAKFAVKGVLGLIPTTPDTVGSFVVIKSQLGSSGGEDFIINEITSLANSSNYGTALSFVTRGGPSVAVRLRIDSSGQLQFKGAGTTGSPGSPAVSFNGSAPSNSLVIDSTGRVGLGTSAPQALLDVNTKSSAGNLNVINASTENVAGAGSQAIYIGAYTGTSYGCKIKSIYNYASALATSLAFETTNTSGALTEAIRIDSSQRVGIGTQTPGRKLSIADSVAPTLGFYRGSTEDGLISSEAAGFAIQTFNNTPIQFSVVSGSSGYSERARIDSSGRLLVGTSSSTASVGQTAQLQVAGSARITSGLASTIDVGSIAQNATTAIALPRSGMYCIYVGTMNLFALFLATINGGSQGVRLIYSTASDVVAGLTTEPAGGTYLRLWISGQQLQVKNMSAFTGPYNITALATGD